MGRVSGSGLSGAVACTSTELSSAGLLGGGRAMGLPTVSGVPADLGHIVVGWMVVRGAGRSNFHGPMDLLWIAQYSDCGCIMPADTVCRDGSLSATITYSLLIHMREYEY